MNVTSRANVSVSPLVAELGLFAPPGLRDTLHFAVIVRITVATH
jgi:hypothetical protein